MREDATEGGPHPGTPEITTSEGDAGSLTGNGPPQAPSSSLSDKDGIAKAVPHYLRASGGSCHDLCKYGRKHTFELKGKRRPFPNLAAMEKTALKGENHVRQKGPAGSLKANLKDKGKLLCKGEVPFPMERPGRSEEAEESSSLEEIGPHEGVGAIEEGVPEAVSECSEESGASEGLNQRKASSGKVHPTVDSESVGVVDLRPAKKPSAALKPRILQKVPTLKRAISTGKAEVSRGEGAPPAKRREGSARPALSDRLKKPSFRGTHLPVEPASAQERVQALKKPAASSEPRALQKLPSLRKLSASLKKPRTIQKIPSVKKPSTSLKPRAVNPSLQRDGSRAMQKLPSLKKPSASPKPRTIQKVPSVKKHSASLRPRAISAMKGQVGKEDGSSPAKRSDGSSSRPPIYGKSKAATSNPTSVRRTGTMGEKITPGPRLLKPSLGQGPGLTLKRLKKTEPSPVGNSKGAAKSQRENVKIKEKALRAVEPRPAKGKGVESAPWRVTTGHGKERTRAAAAKEEGKKVARSDIKVKSEDKSPTPYRLTFRSGKEVSPHQSVVDPPRRLRFRQVRRIGSNLSETGKRSFKRKEFPHSSHRHPETHRVVLRHREIKDKKDCQALLNHVIEETASRLVETSKSKVKALVGAFETVISLQEGRPAAPI